MRGSYFLSYLTALLGVAFAAVLYFRMQEEALAVLALLLGILVSLIVYCLQNLYRHAADMLKMLEEIMTAKKTSALSTLRLDKSEHWYMQKIQSSQSKENMQEDAESNLTLNNIVTNQEERLCFVCGTKNTADKSFCWMCGTAFSRND